MTAKRNILIVDDCESNREILTELLENEYRIFTAENGKEALLLMKQYESSLSAVLLDIVMPVMDGFQLLTEVQNDAALSSIPIIVTTQENNPQSEMQALSLGAADFISKPYQSEIIRHRLRNLIRLRETAAAICVVERDSLTGLNTKEAFYHKMTARLQESPETSYAVLAFDMERFKLINDTYGTERGNQLLRDVAAYLAELCKPDGIASHFHSDLFAALLPYSDDLPQKIAESIEQHFSSYPLTMQIMLKCGIYRIHDLSLSASAMCDRAILAVREIKGQYGKTCALYDDSIRQRLKLEQQMLDEMNHSLEQHRFLLYLQPKYDLATEKIAGMEALVRWQHPTLGLLPPSNFIPLFESNGFITMMDIDIWEQTCTLMEQWKKDNVPLFPVSVNVSRKDFYRVDLPSLLTEMIERHHLTPDLLHLEVTETAYTENPEQLVAVIAQLKERGFVLEMDDFGSAYSSLNMISELPIDVIKLDMKFIQNKQSKNTSRNILQLIVNLAKSLNLPVVAEGIETSEQVKTLRALDFQLAQGYYFARPMPADHCTALLCSQQQEPPCEAFTAG